MDKIFHIRAFSSPNGAYREVELDLPATDYKLLDAMEQLRLEDGKHPYLEFHAAEEYDYLNKRIQETDLFRLNALAQRLAELDIRDMAVFEGLVCMDIRKGRETIPIGSLIDYAYSGDCCHVVEDAVTDEELGRFLVENGFISETDTIPDAALELLDYAQIGKNHREAEGSTFTGFGYKGRDGYKDVCFPCTREFHQQFSDTVVAAYRQELSQLPQRQQEAPLEQEAPPVPQMSM